MPPRSRSSTRTTPSPVPSEVSSGAAGMMGYGFRSDVPLRGDGRTHQRSQDLARGPRDPPGDPPAPARGAFSGRDRGAQGRGGDQGRGPADDDRAAVRRHAGHPRRGRRSPRVRGLRPRKSAGDHRTRCRPPPPAPPGRAVRPVAARDGPLPDARTPDGEAHRAPSGRSLRRSRAPLPRRGHRRVESPLRHHRIVERCRRTAGRSTPGSPVARNRRARRDSRSRGRAPGSGRPARR